MDFGPIVIIPGPFRYFLFSGLKILGEIGGLLGFI